MILRPLVCRSPALNVAASGHRSLPVLTVTRTKEDGLIAKNVWGLSMPMNPSIVARRAIMVFLKEPAEKSFGPGTAVGGKLFFCPPVWETRSLCLVGLVQGMEFDTPQSCSRFLGICILHVLHSREL